MLNYNAHLFSQSLGTPSYTSNFTGSTFITGLTRWVNADVQRSTGKIVYVWLDSMTTTSAIEVYCQIFDQDMNNISSRFRVNKITLNAQHGPVVKVNQEDNSFVVCWGSLQASDNTNDIFVKKISFNATFSDVKNQDELLVNDSTSGHQYQPLLSFDYKKDELLVAWRDDGANDGSGTGGFFRRFDYSTSSLTSSNYIGSDILINQTTSGTQIPWAMGFSPVTDEIIIAYQSPGTSIDGYKRIFVYDESTDSYTGQTETRVNSYLTNDQWPLSLNINSLTGDYVISWTSTGGQDGSGKGAYSKIYNKSHSVIKSDFQISNITAGDQFHPVPVWDEDNQILIYFYMYYSSPSSTIKYRIFNSTGSYTAVANESDAIGGENTSTTFGRGIYPVYNPVNKKVYLSYDIYSGGTWTSKGKTARYQYSHPNIFTPTIVYSELKDELEGSYTRTIGNKLYFKYIEKYNQGATGSDLNYRIYDYKRTLLATATKTKYYGPNFFEVDLEGIAQLGNAGGDNYYILEVINDKGEIKYLRFKYVLEY